MKIKSGTIEQLAKIAGEALMSLDTFLVADRTDVFFEKLGIKFPADFLAQPNLSIAIDNVRRSAADIGKPLLDVANASAAGDSTAMTLAGLTAIQKIAAVVERIGDLGTALKNEATASPSITVTQRIIVQDFISDLPAKFIQFLLLQWLDSRFPVIPKIMGLIGLRDFALVETDTDKLIPPHIPSNIRFDLFGKLIANPVEFLKTGIGFGNNAFDGLDLMRRLKTLLDTPEYRVELDETPGNIHFATSWFTLSVDKSKTPPGLELIVAMPPEDWHIYGGGPLAGPWVLQLDAKGNFASGTIIKISSQGDFTLNPPSGNASLNVSAGIAAEGGPDGLRLLGKAGGTGIIAQRITLKPALSNGSFSTALQVENGKVVIDTSLGDSFLDIITGGARLESSFSIEAIWSIAKGLSFVGNAGLEIFIPVHVEIGPILFNSLYLRNEFDNTGAIGFELSGGFAGSLGPLKLVVERVGLHFRLLFPKNGKGNLGPMDLGIAFKPPTGVGLSIDAAIVKGGGFLSFDTDREEYAGVFELSIAGIVSVKAIGLITTKMPDGSKGFSLLIIISAEFAVGIQLGFGFTLLGVGGLLGLNRTMLLGPIASGVRTGAINSIMFPQDPVANAPRIISDLRSYFPPSEGKFLIGPMIKLGWGTPTLVSLAFGVIVEIPGNIAIVGIMKIALPTEEAPLMIINVAFIGALEFDKSRIWFFAAMFDSRILFMTMEGEMGVLMDYSDHPDFLLSVGGFHPQFNPPPLPFPSPKRIHIDVLRVPVERITVENYFAITTNTVQFGARAELYYGIDAFNLHGNFSFDALFQFSPFHFIIEISFSIGMDLFGVGVFSVTLKFSLSGPAPWEAKGAATLSIDLFLFSIDVSVDFDITWGEADNPKLPDIPVIPILSDEFNKTDNWRASIPAGSNLLVTLRKLDASTEQLVLHPLGMIRFSQRKVPLGVRIDKVGNNPVSDAHLFHFTSSVPNLVTTPHAPQEKFAMAQYQDMSDADKLTKPPFQDIDGGVELMFSGRQLGSGKVVKRIVRYEVKMIDADDKYHAFRWFMNIGALFFHWLGGAAVTKSSLSFAAKKALVPTVPEERVKMNPPGYVIASTADNKILAASPVFLSEAHASDFLYATISKNPVMTEDIHVIPTFEATT